jgi:hypothetical protein
MNCACRYFNPAVEVQPDHIICGEFPHLQYVRASALLTSLADPTGNGCSAGTTPTSLPSSVFAAFTRSRPSDASVLDQLFFTLLDEGDAILLAAP